MQDPREPPVRLNRPITAVAFLAAAILIAVYVDLGSGLVAGVVFAAGWFAGVGAGVERALLGKLRAEARHRREKALQETQTLAPSDRVATAGLSVALGAFVVWFLGLVPGLVFAAQSALWFGLVPTVLRGDTGRWNPPALARRFILKSLRGVTAALMWVGALVLGFGAGGFFFSSMHAMHRLKETGPFLWYDREALLLLLATCVLFDVYETCILLLSPLGALASTARQPSERNSGDRHEPRPHRQ